MTPGPLKSISDDQNLFELKTVGTKLETVVVSTSQDAQASTSQIRSKTRTGGGGSSSGDGTWMTYFEGDSFFGHVAKGGVAAHMLARFPNMQSGNAEAEFSILFQELKSPQRVLEISETEDHVFEISLTSSELGYLFRFRQEKRGRIVCQEINSEFVFARSASSFDEFSKQNAEYVQERLTQVFDFIGVGTPTTRYSPVVRAQVLRMLRPIGEERLRRFKKAVEKMSASSFQERESATAEIEENFKEWQDVIEFGMGNEDFAAETRMRLTRIHDKCVDQAAQQLMMLAQVSKLHLDTEYLIWALEKADVDAEKLVLAKQLSKLTEQEFGVEAAKWTEWFAVNHKTAEAAIEKTQRKKIGDQTGAIETASEFVEQLVKFKINRGELQLEREHWGKPFGDQPIKESVGQVEEILKKNNLPLEWLDAGGRYSLESTEYPQVIFANMAAKLISVDEQFDSKRPTLVYINQEDLATRNRVVNTSKITAQMQFHQETGVGRAGRLMRAGNNRKSPAAKYFLVSFKELADDKRILKIHESENKTISITLISDNVDTVIRFVQFPPTQDDIPADSRCVIYDIRGDQTQELRAANFDDLFRSNEAYMTNEWLPLMEKFGIQIEIPIGDSE